MPLRALISVAFASLSVMALGCEHVTSQSTRTETTVGDSSWTTFTVPGDANVNAVSGTGESALRIVGDHGMIAAFDGSTFAPEDAGTTANLRGVWSVDGEHAFAVGDQGTILERTGGRWTTVGAGLTTATLTAVWADATRAVAVGESGVVLYRGAKDFALVQNEEVQDLYTVTGTAGGAILAAGAVGVIFEVSATSLRRAPVAGFTKSLAGATTSAGGTYFVGLEGSVLRYAGGAFTPLNGFPSKSLRAVGAVGSDVWVVGFEGAIARWTAGQVTPVPSFDGRWLTGIYAASPNAIWIVGRSGLVMRGPPPSLSASSADGGTTLEGGSQ